MEIGDLAEFVSFAAIAPLVIGVAGALIALFVIIKGVRIVMGFVAGSEAGGAGRAAYDEDDLAAWFSLGHGGPDDKGTFEDFTRFVDRRREVMESGTGFVKTIDGAGNTTLYNPNAQPSGFDDRD